MCLFELALLEGSQLYVVHFDTQPAHMNVRVLVYKECWMDGMRSQDTLVIRRDIKAGAVTNNKQHNWRG